jgi:transcriptional regulator GlxA family with amidase domain
MRAELRRRAGEAGNEELLREQVAALQAKAGRLEGAAARAGVLEARGAAMATALDAWGAVAARVAGEAASPSPAPGSAGAPTAALPPLTLLLAQLPALAAAAAMSVRHFSRVFTAEVGETPGHYVERVRVEAARRDLEATDETLDVIARRCGFGTAETLRRSFRRRLGVAPDGYRRRFRTVA